MEPTGKEKKVFVIRVVIFFAVFLMSFSGNQTGYFSIKIIISTIM